MRMVHRSFVQMPISLNILIERQTSHAMNVTYGLIVFILVAIGIPAGEVRGIRNKSVKLMNSHGK